MASYNSLVEFYSALYIELLHDVAGRHGVPLTIITRDIAFFERRIRAEGLPFLTVTLPALGKAVDTALSTDTPLTFEGFRKDPSTSQPLFLGWLFSGVFACDTLLEKADSDPKCLGSLRQLLYVMYKLAVPYSDDRVKQTLDGFCATDESLPSQVEIPELDDDSRRHNLIARLARRLITKVCGSLDPQAIQPKHGPGAVATRETAVQKSYFTTTYAQLEAEYPLMDYFTSGINHVCDSYQELLEIPEEPSGIARVVLVPKDSRGPRIISCEPLSYQWIQQGLKTLLVDRIESHKLTRGFVNFTDQRINRALALRSSVDGSYVTLDMKDASDRVPLELVKYLFGGCPILRGLEASRTPATCLPDGRLVHLKKYAPMGSALCFPVEALVFWALTVATIRIIHALPLDKVCRKVYVYGDDIIVPREVYTAVLSAIPRFGLLFNASKCAYGRFFRESCGCDAYKGVDVTPIKLKTVWSSSLAKSPQVLCSYVALSNALLERGYVRASQFIEERVEAEFGPLPYTDCKSVSFIHWYRPHVSAKARNKQFGFKTRLNYATQNLEMFCFSVRPVLVRDHRPDSWSLLLRRLTTPSEHTSPGEYALPRRIRLKRGWNPVPLVYGAGLQEYYSGRDLTL